MVRKKLRKVLVGGCFDLIHFGHVQFLKKAKAQGNWLVVALESDANVAKLKGKGRPLHSQRQRKAMLEALAFVDEVIALSPMKADNNYLKLVKKVSPAVIAATEGDPHLTKKLAHAKAVGARVVEIPKTIVASTSAILEKLND